ncbi:MAG: hypothetical protein AB2693_13545 [Candidatus Thiodiazotropha sp.]
MQDAHTIDPLSLCRLVIKKTDEENVNGNMVGINDNTKDIEEKAEVFPRTWRDQAD